MAVMVPLVMFQKWSLSHSLDAWFYGPFTWQSMSSLVNVCQFSHSVSMVRVIWDSPVSKVTGYGADSQVSVPGMDRYFSLCHHVQNGSWGPPSRNHAFSRDRQGRFSLTSVWCVDAHSFTFTFMVWCLGTGVNFTSLLTCVGSSISSYLPVWWILFSYREESKQRKPHSSSSYNYYFS